MDTEEFRRRLGKNILFLRTDYGMSRKTLAKLIKMPVGRLQRIENGDLTTMIYDFQLQRIARVFGITIDDLCEGTLY